MDRMGEQKAYEGEKSRAAVQLVVGRLGDVRPDVSIAEPLARRVARLGGSVGQAI
ncbi:MAG: hypothetical protein NTZ69_10710 [Bacteroidia bacterium]|nr:hypothetical protein [Bacteroidia bacterium]